MKVLAGNPTRLLAACETEQCGRSFFAFVRHAWHVVEPTRPFLDGWAIRLLTRKVQDLTEGKLTRAVFNVPPGSAKPVAEDEPVWTTRGLVPLRDVLVGDMVLTHRGRFRRVEAVHQQGRLPTVKVKTWHGRSVRAAKDHPFLTTRGWVPAGELRPNVDVVAATPVREKDDSLSNSVSPEEARFLGYLIGDGSVIYSAKTFTNSEEEVLADFERCAHALGFGTRRNAKHRKDATRIHLSADHTSRLRDYLRWRNLDGKSSYAKRIPLALMAASREAVANYLGAHWTCDGWVAIRHTGKKTTHIASLCTVSEDLAKDVQCLMLRLGIHTRLRAKTVNLKTKRQGDRYTAYYVQASDQDAVARIAALPGLCTRKRMPATRRQFDLVNWPDEVTAVEEGGEAICRCLTVEEDQSFVAGGLAVHNSLLLNVFLPAWEWGPNRRPGMRFVCASYHPDLAVRDNRKCRNLITSDWYRARWGDRFRLTSDQNEKRRFDNDATGFKVGTSVGGLGTGERGHYFLIDDPHNPKVVESDIVREETVKWGTEIVPTRLVDMTTSVIACIAQRTHHKDLCAYYLDLGWPSICLPMEFEFDHPYRCPDDPRTQDGEIFNPDLYPRPVLDKLKETLASQGGDYAASAQLQQRPIPRGGGMFKRQWLPITDDVPPKGIVWVRGWDLAGSTKKKSPWTVGVKMGKERSGKLWIKDVVRERLEPEGMYGLIKTVAKQDGHRCTQDLPQDPGQAGKAQVRSMAALLAGYDCRFSTESGSKWTRAIPLAAQAGAGNVVLCRGPWNDQFIAELTMARQGGGGGLFTDQLDASSRAHARLLSAPVEDVGTVPAELY